MKAVDFASARLLPNRRRQAERHAREKAHGNGVSFGKESGKKARCAADREPRQD